MKDFLKLAGLLGVGILLGYLMVLGGCGDNQKGWNPNRECIEEASEWED